ncbi:heparinase II/III family protein [Paraferrimonas sp. SM1919]|uniref:heparinase II/III domain-containing protein n=1 Tax=Paraferrimonas sp. SM1919 TaxID=2662263 RepID=UPI0013D5542C|nr:heparinase II/III family protein [Paraferrimonas sp. SM1919]
MKYIFSMLLLVSGVAHGYQVEQQDAMSKGIAKIKQLSQQLTQPIQPRPRVLISKQQFKQHMQDCPAINYCYESQQQMIEQAIAELPLEATFSRAMEGRLQRLSYAYKMTSEQRFLDKALEYIDVVDKDAKWPYRTDDLGVSHAIMGLVTLYDWHYDKLSQAHKNELERIFWQAMDWYEDVTKVERIWWANRRDPSFIYANNHTSQANGSMAIMSLALLDNPKFSKRSQQLIPYALHAINSLYWSGLSPDGAAEEGMGYFSYGMERTVDLLATLTATLVDAPSMLNIAAIAKANDFLFSGTGPIGAWNFANGSARFVQSPWVVYLATQRNQPWQLQRIVAIKNRYQTPTDVRHALWYTKDSEDLANQTATPTLPLDNHFRYVEYATIRSDWEDYFGSFLGFKGGRAVVSHGHADAGTFQIQDLGISWTNDLPHDNYAWPYFNYYVDRFNYYRNAPEGHNTLVINPEPHRYQHDVTAHPKITNMHSNSLMSMAQIDLSDAYPAADKVLRGYQYDRAARRFLIQDQVTLKENGEIYWFYHTPADIKLVNDGKSALLEINNKRFRLDLHSEIKTARFTIVDDAPLVKAKLPVKDTPIPDRKKLSIKLTGKGEFKFAVAGYSIGSDSELSDFSAKALPDIENWRLPRGQLAPLTLSINGDKVTLPVNDSHHLITLPEGEMVTILFAGKRYQLSLADNQQQKVVKLTNDKRTLFVELRKKLTAIDDSEFSFSTDLGEQFDVSQLRDGKLTTYYSASSLNNNERVERFIDANFKTATFVKGLDIQFANGFQREFYFDVEVSSDGNTFEKVLHGVSNLGQHSQRFYLNHDKAVKTVRIRANGNSKLYMYNNYAEIKLLKAH